MVQSSQNSGGDGDASVREAMNRVVDSGQRFVHDRLELVRFDITQTLQSEGRRIGFFAAAGLLALLGWIALMAALVWGLAVWVEAWITLGAVGLVHLLIGALLAWRGQAAAGGGKPAAGQAAQPRPAPVPPPPGPETRA